MRQNSRLLSSTAHCGRCLVAIPPLYHLNSHQQRGLPSSDEAGGLAPPHYFNAPAMAIGLNDFAMAMMKELWNETPL